MKNALRQHMATVLFVALFVAWVAIPQLGARAQTTCYLPIVFKTWPPVPGPCTVFPIDNGDGDGNFTVSWTAVRADDYELQEKWEAQDWLAAYLGANTSVDLTHRPAGTYTYRCVARNSWGEGSAGNEVTTVVQGTAPGSVSRPSCSSTNAGGQSKVKVINDCPYVLTLDFTGPQPTLMQLLKCDVCSIYSIIGPIFCPTSNRPIQEQVLSPGDYRVYVTVADPSIRPYVGQWSLSGNCRYTICFYILRSYSTSGAQRQLVPGTCD